MPKHDFFSPKAISNRMKAKGLQKLRWYCEMCQKQCRDENGFKCHLLSEGHNRQMQLFVENPGRYLDDFSKTFEREFLRLLKRGHGTKRVHANVIYQEYIADRQHTHMNSTRWTTLGEFVKHLGRAGFCEVNETEKGWFITYIDRDPVALAKQEAIERENRNKKDESERQRIELEKQIERAFQNDQSSEKVITEFNRENDQKIEFALSKRESSSQSQPAPLTALNTLDVFEKPSEAVPASPAPKPIINAIQTPVKTFLPPVAEKRKRTTLEEIMDIEESKKEKMKRKDYWITPNIVVKVMHKQLGDGKYYKQKGIVRSVIDKYVGEIEMIESGDVIRVDQKLCETVIPNIGGKVLIVNGAYRGEQAVLLSIDTDKFQACVKISAGPYNDRVIDQLDYEDFSKLA